MGTNFFIAVGFGIMMLILGAVWLIDRLINGPPSSDENDDDEVQNL